MNDRPPDPSDELHAEATPERIDLPAPLKPGPSVLARSGRYVSQSIQTELPALGGRISRPKINRPGVDYSRYDLGVLAQEAYVRYIPWLFVVGGLWAMAWGMASLVLHTWPIISADALVGLCCLVVGFRMVVNRRYRPGVLVPVILVLSVLLCDVISATEGVLLLILLNRPVFAAYYEALDRAGSAGGAAFDPAPGRNAK